MLAIQGDEQDISPISAPSSTAMPWGGIGDVEQACVQTDSSPAELLRSFHKPTDARLGNLDLGPEGGRTIVFVLGTPTFRPGDPCPDLLTEEEAIRYLRLDLIDIKNPRASI